MRVTAVLAALQSVLLLGLLSSPAHAANERPRGASWGAIASKGSAFGYSYNEGSRDAAERVARTQCDKAAGRAAPCEVRSAFDGSCGALAAGNYGEWGTASAPTASAAGKAAIGQCESHLPTEPCKVLVSVCSMR